MAVATLAAACSQTNDADQATGGGSDAAAESLAAESEPVALPSIELAARPGPFQLTIDSRPAELSNEASVEVLNAEGTVISTAIFSESGSMLLRNLPQGAIDVEVVDGDSRYQAQPLNIPGEQLEDQSIYGAVDLTAGYNYIPTRDGTTLSAFISLPGSATAGPYPTIVEYSGYSPSDPTAASDPNRLLIPTLGYALVQVNVRGTGCSGGSFDAFERIQSLDGYDIIETVAAQPWSDRVGMFGVSYPGIMQLHVASTQPPSLAAIAALSVTDGVDSVLYPGGIYNDGFGEEWTRRVSRAAQAEGQPWAADRVARGDKTCAANQALREHNPDLVARIKAEPFVGELSAERSARTYAERIEVPTMIAGAWQDEQTGGRFPALLAELGNAPALRAIMYNGLHVDAISGEMLVRIIEFLNLYVGDRPPTVDPITRILISTGLAVIFGSTLPVPDGRYDGMTATEGRVAFEADPAMEILFEQGDGAPNLPVPGFTARFTQWPPSETDPSELFWTAGADGRPELSAEPPTSEASWSYTTDPAEGAEVTIADPATIWTDEPGWSWTAADAEHRVVATSGPLTEELTLVGNMSVDVWVSLAESSDADLEVTISEIHPDGSEIYVQNGWLKLSQRALAPEATELRPVASRTAADVAPLEPGGEPVLARVEVLPFAHVFREGSQLRVTIDTPGASRPQWRFDVDPDAVDVTIHSGPDRVSKIVLPVIPGLRVPTDRPACGVLRGQPCRRG